MSNPTWASARDAAEEEYIDPNPEGFYSAFAANLIKGRAFKAGADFGLAWAEDQARAALAAGKTCDGTGG